MSEHDFNLEDSQENLIVLPDWIPRQKSNDSIFGELIRAPSYGERPLIFPYTPIIQTDKTEFPKVFKAKEKKIRIKKPCDYRKNICGYITKKIIREYLSSTYKVKVEQLCDKHGCDYSTSKTYFLSKIERITGPSHVPSLFVASESWERPIKAAFREFFIWFTKERYLRYLILEGKMDQKEAYIEYKNTVLMSLINKSDQNPKSNDSSAEGIDSNS
jgi:hypothetical protein